MDPRNAEISSQELNSTLLATLSKTNTMSSNDIKHALEEGDTMKRANALECIIRMHLNGESQNHMIMAVIKYITPIDDHYIKKLVLYFWEVVDKLDNDGKLLSVIILICSFLRNDLQHPNEYVRGITLRFLCRVTERDLIEPLISSIVQNLKHRVSYVRRNAVLAVHAIYRKFPDLLHDAVDLIEAFIKNENDVSARRNAFDVLAAFAPDRAAAYLSDFLRENELAESGGVFLMSAADFCQHRIRANPYDKAKYVPILFAILQSKRPAVRFQCASTLLSLSSSQTAIREALLTFVDILKTHSDNSVRLIVVEKLSSMRACYLPILQSSMLDILSALQNCTMDIRESLVLLARELITEKNVEPFVHAMRKELIRVQNDTSLSNASAMVEYKLVLVRAISTAVMHHPQVADVILPILLDNICESSSVAGGGWAASSGGSGGGGGLASAVVGGVKSSQAGMSGAVQIHASTAMSTAGGLRRGSNSSNMEVALLIKEALLVQPLLRPYTLNKLMESLSLVSSAEVARTVLWIFGAYANEPDVVRRVFDAIRSAMHPLPLQRSAPATNESAATAAATGTTASASSAAAQVVTTVREDGTYATSYVYSNMDSAAGAGKEGGETEVGLRNLILSGEYFLATALASTLAKIVVFLFHVHEQEQHSNRNEHSISNNINANNDNNIDKDAGSSNSDSVTQVQSDAMDILHAIIQYGTTEGTAFVMGEDAQEHIRLCLAILARPQTAFYVDFVRDSEHATAVVGQRQFMQSRLGDVGKNKHGNSLAHGGSAPARHPGHISLGGPSSRSAGAKSTAARDSFVPVDAPIVFTPLSNFAGDTLVGQGGPGGMLDDDVMATMCIAGNGAGAGASEESNFLSDSSTSSSAGAGQRGGGAGRDRTTAYLHQIEQVTPYSGYEDEIYVEGTVSVNRFHVTVSWLLLNQTDETFRNVTIELASLGGMRLLERPQSYTLEPRAAIKVHTSLKSSATETGVVFGSLLYERGTGKLVYCPLLNVHVDIMNYVKPATCATSEFRDKWRAYDWENKINIATSQWGSLREYVAYVTRELNMHLLDSPFDEDAIAAAGATIDPAYTDKDAAGEGEGWDKDEDEVAASESGEQNADEQEEEDGADDNEYVSCNLYARTIFNEDALANISVERDARGKINGIIRIRSNTQSVAYGIGEKINMLDKCCTTGS